MLARRPATAATSSPNANFLLATLFAPPPGASCTAKATSHQKRPRADRKLRLDICIYMLYICVYICIYVPGSIVLLVIAGFHFLRFSSVFFGFLRNWQARGRTQ